nr:hypothetical protein [Oligoflexus tunisiensis]
MSLLEVMIGLGVLGILLPLAYKLLMNSGQVGALSEDRLNLRSVARTVESFVDCPNVPPTCVPQQLMDLPKRNGGILIAASGQTMMGDWRVRALCTGDNQFIVQVAKENPKGTFAKDPVTKQVLDWDHPKSTLFAEKTLCPSQPSAPAAPGLDLIEVKAGTSCLVTNKSLLPCNPPTPPLCDPGYESLGMSIDTFGGDDDPVELDVLGQRWMRYCGKISSP